MNIYQKNDKNKGKNIFACVMVFKTIFISMITILFSLSTTFCQDEIVLSVAPANRSVSYSSGSTTFSVANTGRSGTMNWTASESSDWVTLPGNSGTNNGTITAIYQANYSTIARTCTITVTAEGALDSPQDITIIQVGTTPVLSVAPANREVSYNSGSVMFSVANTGTGAMNWTASESSNWVTLSDSVGMNTGTITATYLANNSTSSRSCTITVKALDANGSPINVTINQAGIIPVLAVTPANREVSYNSGSVMFSVANTGTGAMNWTASESSDWVTLSDSIGINTGTITATFMANSLTTPRTCTIIITAPDATGSPKNVTINQAGTTPVLTVTPTNRDVSYASGSTTFSVSNTGSGNMNWTANESSDWVTLSESNGTNSGSVTATYTANNSTTTRTCTITITAQDAIGSPKKLIINQAGTIPVLTVTPANRDVNYNTGSTTFLITNTGSGTMNWTASESSDWVTLSDTNGINTETITATYLANSSTLSRTCTITVTSPDANGSPKKVTISQLGTTPVLSVAPTSRDVIYTSGSTTFSVSNSGSGIMNWTASESSDWVSISDSSGTNNGTITASYTANSSTSPRTCTITVTASDASESSQNIIINQAGTRAVLSVTPTSRDVNYTTGSITFSVSNTGSGTMNWTASESSNWVSLSDSSGTNNGTITASYLANSSTSPRTCTITVTASDASESSQNIIINQAGTKAVLSVTPTSRDISYTTGSITFSVLNTGSGTMNWTASESSDWITLSSSNGSNSGTVTATYLANSSTSFRTCIITITASDLASDATGSPQSITINQAGTKAVLSIAPASRDVVYTSGSTTFLVSNTGSGTMNWIASETSDWVSLSDSIGTNSGTIIAAFKANNSSSPKTCIITVTASDSASDAIGSPKEITILQQGKIETDDENSRNRWGGSNILALKIKEDFLNVSGIKKLPDISKHEIIEDDNVKPLPKIIASGASNVYRIIPGGVFNKPVHIKIPINTTSKDKNLMVYYYSESSSHSGWYNGENVTGWMVSGSNRILSENGQSYYELVVNHSGIVQVGEIKQVSLGEIVSIDFGINGSSQNWRLFAGILFLMCICMGGILRKYHSDKNN